MNDRKPPRRNPPAVEVIRKPPGSSPAAPGPSAPAPVAPSAPPPAPRPVPVPRPISSGGPPRPAPSGGPPRPVPGPSSGAPPRPGPPGGRPAGGGFERGGGRPGGPGGFRRPSAPRRPPTEEEVLALAVKEHVPYRIARGDLEGKMKCRVWRKLHAEEAKRFDQAYALMQQYPDLTLADAFALVQSGMSIDELKTRRDRTQKKAAVKEARGAVSGEAVDTFLQTLIAEKVEVSVVLGDRTVVDVLTGTEPIAFKLERT